MNDHVFIAISFRFDWTLVGQIYVINHDPTVPYFHLAILVEFSLINSKSFQTQFKLPLPPQSWTEFWFSLRSGIMASEMVGFVPLLGPNDDVFSIIMQQLYK